MFLRKCSVVIADERDWSLERGEQR